jgi:hypothetical protein
MKRWLIVLTVFVAAAPGLVRAPAAALAWDRHHDGVRRSTVLGGRAFVGPVVPHPFFPHRFFGPVFPHAFVPFTFGVSPAVVYAAPPVVYTPPLSGYAAPSISSYPQLPPPATLAPPPPPMPSVVQYPTGRYELRGDGMTTPYVWVWIPNPPAGPPPSNAPPTAPPAGPPAPPVPPGPRSQIYCWTDDEGVTTWTDDWESLPERYRDQVKRRNQSNGTPSTRVRTGLLCLGPGKT